ncbi:DUF4870 domain-containing protein [Lapillicoccus jejuensis]|uniref:Tic20 family protein n=1 Tax=Lapillicoccus jejuensis TaxID=402171 RepID=A0A542E6D7_9MICO|nr:DUF4870 domain-containing protein [Lapillicoccus jejuensis]TQJ10849.1 hypothetical protein FB458_3990 [Lapillicoccus jejuensis]
MSSVPPPVPPYGGARPAISSEERTASVLAHLSALIAAIVTAGWLSFVGPLVIWAIYKDRSPMVRQAAAGSFNFNLGLWVMNVVAWICLFTVVLIPLAIILFLIANVGMVVWHLLAAYRASQGRTYSYPFQIRILH